MSQAALQMSIGRIDTARSWNVASPQTFARLTGVVYLAYFLSAVIGEIIIEQAGVSSLSGVSGDADTLAHKLIAQEGVYRLGLFINVIAIGLYVALNALFFYLFRPVGRSLSLVAALLNLTAQAVAAVGIVFQLTPLSALDSGSYLAALPPAQRQAVALAFLQVAEQAGHVALLFSGLFQLVLGYLIFRSTYLPRVIGVLIALAGVGWLTYMFPSVEKALLTPSEVLGFLAEASLMVWLLVKGVSVNRWNGMVGS